VERRTDSGLVASTRLSGNEGRAMGIRDGPTAAQSPWHNGYAERLIGSICENAPLARPASVNYALMASAVRVSKPTLNLPMRRFKKECLTNGAG
jgi:hypothetical protein